MGYVPYVGFATHRRAIVKIHLYFKRLMFMKYFVYKKKMGPHTRIPDPLGIQTLMKSNPQLRHEAQGGVPQPPSVPPTAASSSSQAVPLTFDIEAAFSQLMSSMETLQCEVTLIGERVEQCHIDIRECLQYHHPTADDED